MKDAAGEDFAFEGQDDEEEENAAAAVGTGELEDQRRVDIS